MSERTLRVAIVDDEPLARRRLRRLVGSIPNVRTVCEASDGEDAERKLRRHAPDAVLLDVEMPGLSGLDLVRELDPRPAIIIVTAYEKYAIDAFDIAATDYVVKPVNRARLALALDRARAAVGAENASSTLTLFYRRGGSLRTIAADEVEYFEAKGDYVAAWRAGEYVLLTTTLRELEESLPAPAFIRIHRSVIVNRAMVEGVRTHAGGRLALTLCSGDEVVASRRRTAATRAQLRGSPSRASPPTSS